MKERNTEPFRIRELFCFAVIDDDGTEGVPAILSPAMGNTMMPLMGADADRIESYLPKVRKLQQQSGKKFRLYKFTQKEEIDWEKEAVGR